MDRAQVGYRAAMLPEEAAQKQSSLAGCVMKLHGTHHGSTPSWHTLPILTAPAKSFLPDFAS